MRIGIVGGGVVGSAIFRGMVEHCESVLLYDVNPAKSLNTLLEVVTQCAVIFVAVPTPRGEFGPLDVTAVESAVRSIDGVYKRQVLPAAPPVVVIKSTVNVSTTEQLAGECTVPVIHSPEFLTARCAALDFAKPSRNIIGVPDKWKGSAAVETLVDLYKRRWAHCPLLVMKSNESELVKLAQNAFFAVKVGHFHATAKTCCKYAADYEVVRRAILCDGRLAPDHTKQPGSDGKFGFGAACLPKDLAAFAAAAGPLASWLCHVSECNDITRMEPR